MSARKILAAVAVLTLLVPAVAAIVAWRQSARDARWTDGSALQVPVADATARSVIWAAPTRLDTTGAPDADAYEPRASPDGTVLVFVQRRPDANADLVVRRWRPSGWSEPVALASVNTDADELGPEFAADGRTIWFVSNREGGIGGYDLWCAPYLGEGDAIDAWGSPVNAGAAINSAFDEYGPALTPDGKTLYFASDRPAPGEADVSPDREWSATMRERRTRRDHDLYVAGIAGDSAPARRLDALSTPHDEGAPALSPIGDFLYFASDRPGGRGGFDLWRSRLVDGVPGVPERLDDTLNGPSNELDPALSSDGFRLYFSSDRGDGADRERRYDLWRSISREVYRDSGSFGDAFAAAFLALLPWTILLLALALLAALLWWLFARTTLRDRMRALSLLGKCLIASALVHLLLAFALACWTVGTKVGELMRSGGTRVILASGADHGSTAAQILAPTVDAQTMADAAPTAPSPLVVAAAPPSIELVQPAAVPTPLPPRTDDARPDPAPDTERPTLALAAPAADVALQRPSLEPASPRTPVAPRPTASPEASADAPTDPMTPSATPPTTSAATVPVAVAPAAPISTLPPREAETSSTVATVERPDTALAPAPSDAPPAPQATQATHIMPSESPALPAAPEPSRAHATERPALDPATDLSRLAPPMPSRPVVAAPAAPTLPAPASAPVLPASALERPAAPPIDGAAALPALPLPSAPTVAAPMPTALPSAASAAMPPIPTPRESFEQRAPESRGELVKSFGGNAETERAVGRALEWFARVQSSDGHWDSRAHEAEASCDTAMTGLALLSFLGAGHTHLSEGPYRENVAKALAWLRQQQRGDGDLRKGTETMFGQTIAAVALCEAFAMTRDPELAEPARRATNFVFERHARASAAPDRQSRDVAVIGWLVMTAESARRAGFDPPESVARGARRWLDTVSDPRGTGRYAYRAGAAPTVAMTAEALFVQQLLGAPRTDARAARSAQFLAASVPTWSREAPTHSWYYTTLALFQHQGEAWEAWNSALAPLLVRVQRTDGPDAGSWDPQDEWSRTCGRVYQTAICTLSLEVYYRYRVESSDAGVDSAR
ncbi:MAG: PD40 domain-containing protein [Phycisphaerae bacterium]|nr:PD40 domain-containing protein [Phycisphaerae bacterium]